MLRHPANQDRSLNPRKHSCRASFALLFVVFGACLFVPPQAAALPNRSGQGQQRGGLSWEALKASTLGRTRGGSLSLPPAVTAKVRSLQNSPLGRGSWETALRRAATRLTIMAEYVRKDWQLSSADAGKFLRRTFSFAESSSFGQSGSSLTRSGAGRSSFAGLGALCGETLGEAYRYLSLLSDNIASVTAKPLTLAVVKGDYQGALDTLEGMSVELERRSREALR
jgi:hypothetical protein